MNKTLALVNITGITIGISYGLHGPILPVFAKNVIGASYTELGLIGLASFLPYMFIPLFVGVLLDRFNNGHLLALGSALNAGSVYLLSMSQSVPEIMGYRVMAGIAHAFFWPPCESIISDQSSQKDRVRNISWFAMFFVVGFMAGPLVGTVLLEGADAGYRAIFQITAFIMAATLISALLASRISVTGSYGRPGISSIREMKKFPEVAVMVVYFTASFGIVLSIYPAFLSNNGMSDFDVLLLYFVFGISRVASLALAGRLAGMTGSVLACAAAAVAAGLAVSAVADSMLAFAAALLLMGFGFSIFFPLTLEVVLRRTSRAISGKVIGMYETMFGIGMAIGPALGGPISQSFGDRVPYAAFAAIGICVMVLALISRKRLTWRDN